MNWEGDVFGMVQQEEKTCNMLSVKLLKRSQTGRFLKINICVSQVSVIKVTMCKRNLLRFELHSIPLQHDAASPMHGPKILSNMRGTLWRPGELGRFPVGRSPVKHS